MQKSIVNRVERGSMYTIISDETTNESHIEQLSLSVWYIHDGSIRQHFLTLINVYDRIRLEDICDERIRRLTGVASVHIVEDVLHKFSLHTNKCMGTDNCFVMFSDVS